MISLKQSVLFQSLKSTFHAGLFVSYEIFRLTALTSQKSFKDLCESLGSLLASYGDTKGNNLIKAIDASKNANCILFVALKALFDQPIG